MEEIIKDCIARALGFKDHKSAEHYQSAKYLLVIREIEKNGEGYMGNRTLTYYENIAKINKDIQGNRLLIPHPLAKKLIISHKLF